MIAHGCDGVCVAGAEVVVPVIAVLLPVLLADPDVLFCALTQLAKAEAAVTRDKVTLILLK